MNLPVTENLVKWTERLAFDVALLQEYAEKSGEGRADPKDIRQLLKRHGLTRDELTHLAKDPEFARTVDACRTTIAEEGVTFRNKARLLAEDALLDYYNALYDEKVPAATRNDIYKNLVRWAGLEPSKDATGPTLPDSRFSITINLGETSVEPATVVSSTPPAIPEG